MNIRKSICLVLALVLMVPLIVQAKSLVQELTELHRLRKQNAITDAEFERLKSDILNRTVPQSNYTPATPEPQSLEERPLYRGSQDCKLTVEVYLARYWRAKEVHRLTDNVTVKVNGQPIPGKRLSEDQDLAAYSFEADVEPGKYSIHIAYQGMTRKVQGNEASSWNPQEWQDTFYVDINRDKKVQRVFDLIQEKKTDVGKVLQGGRINFGALLNKGNSGANYSTGNAKVLSMAEYTALNEERKRKEHGR